MTSRLLAAALLCCSLMAHAADTPKLAGTFSSLEYNEEGGDLLGYEVRIIPSSDGLMAVVQAAEGEAGKVYLVPVTEKAGTISFPMTSEGGAARFAGRLTKSGLKGVVTSAAGAKEQVFLKRGASYWEK